MSNDRTTNDNIVDNTCCLEKRQELLLDNFNRKISRINKSGKGTSRACGNMMQTLIRQSSHPAVSIIRIWRMQNRQWRARVKLCMPRINGPQYANVYKVPGTFCQPLFPGLWKPDRELPDPTSISVSPLICQRYVPSETSILFLTNFSNLLFFAAGNLNL